MSQRATPPPSRLLALPQRLIGFLPSKYTSLQQITSSPSEPSPTVFFARRLETEGYMLEISRGFLDDKLCEAAPQFQIIIFFVLRTSASTLRPSPRLLQLFVVLLLSPCCKSLFAALLQIARQASRRPRHSPPQESCTSVRTRQSCVAARSRNTKNTTSA